MARAKPGDASTPRQRREPPDQSEPDAGVAPDVALSVLDFVRTRRCVKVAVVYLALGWALLEFTSFAMQGRPSAGLVRDLALVLYLCGFFIVLTGAYLVMSGKHPLRTVMIAGLVSASALAGAGIAIVGYQYLGTSEPAAPATEGPRQADTSAPASIPRSSGGQPVASAPTPPAPGATPSTTTAGVVGAPVSNAPVITSPSTPSAPAVVTSPPIRPTTSPLPNAAVTPRQAAPADAAPTSAGDSVDSRLARLVLRFGDTDQRVLTIEDTRPVSFLDRYDEPITIRVIPGIRVQVTNPFDKRIQVLRFTNPGETGTHRVVVPSGCGDLPYDVTATVITRQQLRVGVVLDRDAARAAVERTVQLGRCVGMD